MGDVRTGDTVFFWRNDVHARNGAKEPKEFVVCKVGRKWATCAEPGCTRDAMRFNVETLAVDGGAYSSPGKVWLSLDAWRADRDARLAWAALRVKLDRTYSPPVGAEYVRIAARILGLGELEASHG